MKTLPGGDRDWCFYCQYKGPCNGSCDLEVSDYGRNPKIKKIFITAALATGAAVWFGIFKLVM